MYCDQCGARMAVSAAVCPRCSAPAAPPPSDPVPQPRPLAKPGTAPEPRPGPRPQHHRGGGSAERGAAWLSAALTRNWPGTLAGLIGAWFNLPLVVFMAGAGAVFGGLGGVLSGTVAGPGGLARLDVLMTWILPLPFRIEELLPTAAVQTGGVLGGLMGAFSGAVLLAWLSVAEFWRLLYQGDPFWPFAAAAGQAATAFLLAGLYTAYSVLLEGWRLRLSGARRPSRREAAWLEPMVREAARRLGCRSVPPLYVDDSRLPDAYAGVRCIVVNRGLLEFLCYEETAVAGVIAHEVAHWRRGDALSLVWSRGLALPLFLVYEPAVKACEAVRWRPVQFFVHIVLWSVMVTVKHIVMPAHAAGARRCEYAADAAAKAAGYGEGLHRALDAMGRGFDGARTGWEQAILATHPCTELRLERLEAPDRAYRLPRGGPFAEPVPALARPAGHGPDKD